MNILLIACGGALGAVCRYLAGNMISRIISSALPWGTFLINIGGSFAMGVLMTLIVEREVLPAAWRLFLCVGLLGGFTTFSSFSYEALSLLMEGRLAASFCYAGGSIILGMLSAGLGVFCARSF